MHHVIARPRHLNELFEDTIESTMVSHAKRIRDLSVPLRYANDTTHTQHTRNLIARTHRVIYESITKIILLS